MCVMGVYDWCQPLGVYVLGQFLGLYVCMGGSSVLSQFLCCWCLCLESAPGVIVAIDHPLCVCRWL